MDVTFLLSRKTAEEQDVIIPREDTTRRLLVSTGTDVWDTRLVNAMGAFISALALLAAAVLWWRRQRLS